MWYTSLFKKKITQNYYFPIVHLQDNMVTPSRALGALLISPLCIPDKGQGESSTFKEEVELLQERHVAGKFSGLNPE